MVFNILSRIKTTGRALMRHQIEVNQKINEKLKKSTSAKIFRGQ